MVVMYRGWKVCECQRITLPLIEAEMKAKGIISQNGSITIFQAGYNKGGVTASAGTHDGGGVLDTGNFSDAALAVWRSWGVEMQHRTVAQKFSPHGHGVWKGCPHVSSGAAYQQSEWEAGRNGLVGRGPITGPGPKGSSTPTWQQAVKNKKPAAPPEPKGLLGMTQATSMRRSTDWRIPTDTSGKWNVAFPLNDSGSATAAQDTGDQIIVYTANVTITGLKDGEAIDIAWTICDTKGDGGDAKWPTGWSGRRDSRRLVGGAAGYRTAEITFVGKLGKGASGRSKRLRLVYQTASKTAVLGSATVEGAA
jgi:hypothetical protein